jgi:hypothetical protein
MCWFSFWWKVPKGYMALEQFFVSARTIKRHHHLPYTLRFLPMTCNTPKGLNLYSKAHKRAVAPKKVPAKQTAPGQATPRKFGWHHLDDNIQELICNYTAASFTVEHSNDTFVSSPEFGSRPVQYIVRYEFNLMRRNIAMQEGLVKKFSVKETWSSISKIRTVLRGESEYQAIFHFVRSTEDGMEEVLKARFPSRFAQPGKKKGILKDVRKNFKTMFNMNCVLERGRSVFKDDVEQYCFRRGTPESNTFGV